jgi:glycerol-1-phosphate dehydrogenase [NAD(P)+]
MVIPAGVEEILSEQVLGQSLSCSCGRDHQVVTRQVVIERGVAESIPELLPSLARGKSILLVADQHTRAVAGEQLHDALSRAYTVTCCLLHSPADGHIHASVELADELAAAYSGDYDLYAAVGSGTINDLVKELAHRRQRPYFVLATAASMNGYTSAIVALLERGLKTTRPSTPPVAVFADPQVLVEAPPELTLAGLGDLISKPYCGCDWKIASLVKDEYYCPTPNQMLAEPFALLLERLPQLGVGDPEGVTLLLRLLLVSGLTMAIAGTSSPASGAEHLLSHYWDMIRLRDGRSLNLHGAQVGVASLVIDQLYQRISSGDLGHARFRPSPPKEQLRTELAAVFGSLTPAVWPQWQQKLTERSEHDLARLRRHEVAIRTEIEQTLELGRAVRQVMSACGAPTRAEQLGISPAELAAAVRHARKIRTRFTALDVAAELDLLDAFAAELGETGA